MTNEELAFEIGRSGNNDLVSVLWEQTYKYFKMRAERYYRRFQEKCDIVGVDLNDLVQECYFVLVDGIRAYNQRPTEQKDYPFLAYCKFPIKNRFAIMLGYRGHQDPLNNERYSLNDIVPNGEGENLTYLDVVIDLEAEKPFRDIEDLSCYRAARKYIRELLEKDGGSHYFDVIERRYFRGQTYTEIAMTLELSRERVRQIEKSALKLLRESYELKQLTVYSPYRHVGLESFKHNGSIEEQIAERKEFDRWRNNILERILKKG